MVAVRNHELDPFPGAPALDIERQIGNTPLVGFRRITAHLPENVAIYAKAEWANPGGSVKDRAALNIIRQGEVSGELMNTMRLNELVETLLNSPHLATDEPSATTVIVDFTPLNARELELLRLIADGMTNKEIATELVLAVSTVK